MQLSYFVFSWILFASSRIDAMPMLIGENGPTTMNLKPCLFQDSCSYFRAKDSFELTRWHWQWSYYICTILKEKKHVVFVNPLSHMITRMNLFKLPPAYPIWICLKFKCRCFNNTNISLCFRQGIGYKM